MVTCETRQTHHCVLLSLGVTWSGINKAGGFSAKDIAKNPAMARLLVTAARRMKAVQLREAQEELERQRAQQLPDPAAVSGVEVQNLHSTS